MKVWKANGWALALAIGLSSLGTPCAATPTLSPEPGDSLSVSAPLPPQSFSRTGRLAIGFQVGATVAFTGELDRKNDAGLFVGATLDYEFTDRFAVGGHAGLLQLNSEPVLDQFNPRWYGLTANATYQIPIMELDRMLYLSAGAGAYYDKLGETNVGGNLGFGVHDMVIDETYLSAGVDYHYIDGVEEARHLLTLHLGVGFR